MEFSNQLINMHLPPWILIVGGLSMAFIITFLSIPPIVKLARTIGLYDLPNGRTSHLMATPYLGGIGVFLGLILSTVVMAGAGFTRDLIYIIAGLIIILFVGLKDDIVNIDPFYKLIGQLIASGIIVLFGDIRIDNFYGCLGMDVIPCVPSILFTIFVIIVIINGINLIDGIDGLASGVCILISVTLGIWFTAGGFLPYSILSFSLAGSLSAFFHFNVFNRKYKIFLGDTGSLIVGLTIAILTIRFIGYQTIAPDQMVIHSVPAIAFGILIIPLFDTLRVFVLRISQGRSPFSADRQHLHHNLLDLGYSHYYATLILIGSNFFFIVLSFGLQDMQIFPLILLQLGLATAFTFFVAFQLNRRRTKAHHRIHFAGKEVEQFNSLPRDIPLEDMKKTVFEGKRISFMKISNG